MGAERRVHGKGLGRFDEEFLAWEPGAKFGFAVLDMGRPVFRALDWLITIEPDVEGVVVTYTQAFEPKSWSAPLFKLAARTSLPKALAKGLDGLADRAAAG